MSALDVLEVDMATIPMFVAIQRNGLLINHNEFALLDKEFSQRMEELQSDINRLAGRTVNPGSPEQVEKLLFKDMGLHTLSPIARQTKMSGQGGNPERWTTSSDVLMSVIDKHPVVEPIIRWKEYNKLVTTYLRTLPLMADSDGRVRSKNLRITRTTTGRPSMSEPNLLNQPRRSKDAKRVRRGFVAGKGKVLVELDLSQIEMRMAAHCSEDPVMCAIFDSDGDIHDETASSMFRIPIDQVDSDTHRDPCKSAGFGILYLISARGLLQYMIDHGIKGWDEDGCQGLIDRWYEVYGGIKAWQEEVKARARRYGRVEDIFGRVRLIPEVMSVHKSVREAGIRQAVNGPIQMGAGGVIKRVMVRVWNELVEPLVGMCDPLLQIYDSLLFEVEEGLAVDMAMETREVMGSTVKLKVPVNAKAEMGSNWGEMEKVK